MVVSLRERGFVHEGKKFRLNPGYRSCRKLNTTISCQWSIWVDFTWMNIRASRKQILKMIAHCWKESPESVFQLLYCLWNNLCVPIQLKQIIFLTVYHLMETNVTKRRENVCLNENEKGSSQQKLSSGCILKSVF